MGFTPSAVAQLGPRPPEQQNPLDTYGKILGLRQLQNAQVTQQQQQQLQQQDIQKNQFEVQDREAGMKAMQQWDGKSQSEIPDLIKKNGGSLNAVLGAQQAVVKQATDVAAMNTAQLNNSKAKSDFLLGKLQAATSKEVPDEQLPSSIMQAAQDSVQAGYLDPQHAQALQQITQQYANDPAGLRTHLSIFEKSLQSQSEQFAQTAKEKELQNQTVTANAAQLRAENTSPSAEAIAAKAAQGDPGAIATQKEVISQAAQKAAAEASAKQPIEVDTEVKKQLALQKQNPAALANVRQNLIAPATAAYTKAGEEYATAVQSAQNMEDFLQAAKSGNKEAVKIVPLQGALEITTAQGVHRINRTEVDQYGGAGDLYDKLAGKIGGVITGKDITDSVLNDMGALQKTVAQNATTLHGNKVATINKAYGSQFQPMDFSAGGSQGGGQATSKAAPPATNEKPVYHDGKLLGYTQDGKTISRLP